MAREPGANRVGSMRLGAAVRIRGTWRSDSSAGETHESISVAVEDSQTKPKQPEFTVRDIVILGDSDPGVRISMLPTTFLSLSSEPF